jgi:hypothetical protein
MVFIKIKIENKQSFFGKKVARNCLKDQFQSYIIKPGGKLKISGKN